jgi:hypothetical protein
MERAESDKRIQEQRVSDVMAFGTDADRRSILQQRDTEAAGLERERLAGAAGLERERLANAGTMDRVKLEQESATARTKAEIEAKAALGKYTPLTDTFGTPIGTLNASTGELKHFPEIQAKHRADELIAQIGTDEKPVKYITAYHLNQLNALPLEEQKAFLARYQEQNPKQYEKLKQSFKAASGGAQ